MISPLTRERELLRRFGARLTAQQGVCRVPALILMTDDDRDVDWIEAIKALPRGAAVIVRSRCSKAREGLAIKAIAVAKPRGIHVAIASDIKLAIRLRAAGLHFPEKDSLRARQIRRSYPRMFLTVSAHGLPGLRRASLIRADAALLSPILTTASHPGAHPLGPRKWAAMRNASHIPVIALGGVTANSAVAAIAAGAVGLAIIGGWTQRP